MNIKLNKLVNEKQDGDERKKIKNTPATNKQSQKMSTMQGGAMPVKMNPFSLVLTPPPPEQVLGVPAPERVPQAKAIDSMRSQ